jgi:nitrogen fixation/metabolism regulation signal transduction histidine kinase
MIGRAVGCGPRHRLGLAIVKAIVERHHGSIALADASEGAERPGLAVSIVLGVG